MHEEKKIKDKTKAQVTDTHLEPDNNHVTSGDCTLLHLALLCVGERQTDQILEWCYMNSKTLSFSTMVLVAATVFLVTAFGDTLACYHITVLSMV